MQVDKKTAALIALVLAGGGAGAAHFLKENPRPTQRTVFAACETGELRGIACCEDMNKVSDMTGPIETVLAQCGMVTPGQSDPFGVRKQLEDAWDAAPPIKDVYVPPSTPKPVGDSIPINGIPAKDGMIVIESNGGGDARANGPSGVGKNGKPIDHGGGGIAQ